MKAQQVFVVVNWMYDQTANRLRVSVPVVFTNKRMAMEYVAANKIPNDPKQWEVHTTVGQIGNAFNFSTDITPNFG